MADENTLEILKQMLIRIKDLYQVTFDQRNEIIELKGIVSALHQNLLTHDKELRDFKDMTLLQNKALWERSRERWREDEPDKSLTWGQLWNGNAFIEETLRHFEFTPETRILEIGPGYGRLLDQIRTMKLPFCAYTAVELSDGRVQKLREKYKDDNRISFVCGDVETFSVPEAFNICISSSTFSHFFPSFMTAIGNISKYLVIGGSLHFDVSEGHSGGFQQDGRTFGRCYSIAELEEFQDSGGVFGNVSVARITHGQDALGADVSMLHVSMRKRAGVELK